MDENENALPVTDEELVSMLNDPKLLEEHGFRLTPKGYMALVLMEMSIPNAVAEDISQAMENRIFLGGWTYFHEDQLGEKVFPDDE